MTRCTPNLIYVKSLIPTGQTQRHGAIKTLLSNAISCPINKGPSHHSAISVEQEGITYSTNITLHTQKMHKM